MIFPELLMIVTVSVNGILTYGTALDAPIAPYSIQSSSGRRWRGPRLAVGSQKFWWLQVRPLTRPHRSYRVRSQDR